MHHSRHESFLQLNSCVNIRADKILAGSGSGPLKMDPNHNWPRRAPDFIAKAMPTPNPYFIPYQACTPRPRAKKWPSVHCRVFKYEGWHGNRGNVGAFAVSGKSLAGSGAACWKHIALLGIPNSRLNIRSLAANISSMWIWCKGTGGPHSRLLRLDHKLISSRQRYMADSGPVALRGLSLADENLTYKLYLYDHTNSLYTA